MTHEQGKPVKDFSAEAYKTDLATLITHEQVGALLTKFILIQLGTENPYKGCIVEIAEGPDAGKQFVANVGKPQRFLEPMTITLIKEFAKE